jgi:hypothetical protein
MTAMYDNFMIQDLAEGLAAFSLFPLFLLIPGYVLGWLTDVLSFRRRVVAVRIALSVVLAVAVFPIVTYLIARLIFFPCVWFVYASTWLTFLLMVTRSMRRIGINALLASFRNGKLLLPFTLALGAWVVLTILALSDIQIADRLYVSWVYGDYAKDVAVTDAITRGGLPPANPFFYPGHPVGLFYYYFWFLMCSLVDQLGGRLVGPRAAVIASAVWSGLALTATVVSYVCLTTPAHHRHKWARVAAGMGLLFVSGLDVVPIVCEALVYLVTDSSLIVRAAALFLGTTGWNHDASVVSWLTAVTWVPHHVASLLACLAGHLLFRSIQQTFHIRDQVNAVVMAGCAFASAVGLSIWVSFVFAVSQVILVLLLALKRRYVEVRFLVVIGLVVVLLSLPYLLDLQRARHLDVAPIVFAIRAFGPTQRIASRLGIHSSWMWLVNLLFLPVNYFLEFGFVGVAAILYWKGRARLRTSHSQDDVFSLAMFSASMLVSTFLRSSVRNNDLGWRGVMIAQFVLLIWAIDLVIGVFNRLLKRREAGKVTKSPAQTIVHGEEGLRGTAIVWFNPGRTALTCMVILLVIGGITWAYDFVSLRTYAVLKSRYDDKQFAARFYAVRQAYAWINNNLSPAEIVQHNSDVVMDLFHGLYGHRQVIAGDYAHGTLFGIDESDYRAATLPISRLFTVMGNDRTEAGRVCSEFSIATLIVKDTDPIWRNSRSWVWRQDALFSNEFARVFACESLLR